MANRKTADDYQNLAKQYNFEWVGDVLPRSTVHLTTWRCANGHEWKARYCNIYMGSGCPHCYGNARIGPMHYHALAHWHGIYWIGPEVPTVIDRTRWALSDGVVFEDTYRNLAERKRRDKRFTKATYIAMRRYIEKLSEADLTELKRKYGELEKEGFGDDEDG